MDDRSTCTQGAAGHTDSDQGHDTVTAGSSDHVSVQEDVTVHGIDPTTGATTDATLTLRDIDDRRYDLSEDGTYAGADGAAGHTASD